MEEPRLNIDELFETKKKSDLNRLSIYSKLVARIHHKIKMTSKFMHQLFLETGENLYKHLSDEIVNFEDMAVWKANRVGRWEQEYTARSNPKIKQYRT